MAEVKNKDVLKERATGIDFFAGNDFSRKRGVSTCSTIENSTTEVITHGGAEHFSLKWRIENFGLRLSKLPIVSDPLTQNGTTWQMKIDGAHSVKLILRTPPSRWIVYKLSDITRCSSAEYLHYGSSSDRDRILEKPVLVIPNKEVLLAVSNERSNLAALAVTRVLHCEIESMIEKPDPRPLQLATVRACDISSDFKRMFKAEEYSDFKIKAGNKEFKVHRVMLSASSSKFKEIIRNTIEQIITIDDIEPNVVEEMLTYIYTGEAPNIHEVNMAENLLHAADKYQLDHLKAMCEDVLSKSMTDDNIARTLHLAKLHDATQLKDRCFYKIYSNWRNFMKTDQWEKIKDDTELTAELLEIISTQEDSPPSPKKQKLEDESDCLPDYDYFCRY